MKAAFAGLLALTEPDHETRQAARETLARMVGGYTSRSPGTEREPHPGRDEALVLAGVSEAEFLGRVAEARAARLAELRRTAAGIEAAEVAFEKAKSAAKAAHLKCDYDTPSARHDAKRGSRDCTPTCRKAERAWRDAIKAITPLRAAREEAKRLVVPVELQRAANEARRNEARARALYEEVAARARSAPKPAADFAVGKAREALDAAARHHEALAQQVAVLEAGALGGAK